ncbi:hypothetical protein [Christiangramia sp. OXR-203]|uniref:hypothetical protein n=1 Tax=Christiangramia sp. OXR-203 TaxID=3100176 RepID=UPI002AC8A993|nr:hypothetical protein [Christiangramia sp. OXR-203]WPY99768.1 hypothetical protein T8I65_06040 [Christiangramia sp. OXR-203]
MMNLLLILGCSVLSGQLTYTLNNSLNLGAVIASSLVSITGGLLIYTPISEVLRETLPLVIMGASFVGMASEEIATRNRIIILSSIFFGILFYCTGVFFEGFGGSLGTTAAIAFFASLGFQQLVFKKGF